MGKRQIARWHPSALAAAALGLCVLFVSTVSGQPPAQQASPEIKVQQIRRNVFMLIGDGANVTLQTELPAGEENYDGTYGGDVGVLIVDTGVQTMSGQLLAAIRKLSTGPIRYIVNTSVDADHVGGNEALSKVSGGIVRGALSGKPAGPPLMILAHETVLERMGAPSGQQPAYPLDAWPTDVFARDKEVFFNGGSAKIMHQSGAHTDGDSIVYLRRSDVISAGEIFSTANFPRIDASKGGHIQGILDGLNRILEIAIPGEKEQGGTMIVPGHGRLSDEADVEFYREMVQIVRDRIQDGIMNGMTLEQVKAARPALEYERLYSRPDWTTDMFVEAVYRDIAQARKPASAKQTSPPVNAKEIMIVRMHRILRHRLTGEAVLGLIFGIVAIGSFRQASAQAPSAQQRSQEPKPEDILQLQSQTPRSSATTGKTGRAGAAFDLTGYWVAVINEDWRWRMITPDKGDFSGVPLNFEGRRVADTWDAARDEANGEQCRVYGAPSVLRLPTRLHIAWAGDNTLKIETDFGSQTRLLYFGETPSKGERSWQGISLASWEVESGPKRSDGPTGPRDLKVTTTNLRAGYLRRNGIPYSGNAILTEYFDLIPKQPNGDEWLVVNAMVDDPRYLTERFIISSNFKKEPDGSKWHPTPCSSR